MRNLVFGNVNPEGFLGFADELEKGEWATIDLSAIEGPNRTALKPLCDVPTAAGWKLTIKWSIGALREARDGAGNAKDLDHTWDAKQAKLSALIHIELKDDDAARRAAAKRLENVMLRGAGTEQTKRKYNQEVDFGQQQVLAAASGQTAADVALLGFGPLLGEIAAATENLAAATGHGSGDDRPSERFRIATADCAAVFASVSGRILWVTTHGQAGEDRQRAQRLLDTLSSLVDRYPAQVSAPADPGPEATTPADPPAQKP